MSDILTKKDEIVKRNMEKLLEIYKEVENSEELKKPYDGTLKFDSRLKNMQKNIENFLYKKIDFSEFLDDLENCDKLCPNNELGKYVSDCCDNDGYSLKYESCFVCWGKYLRTDWDNMNDIINKEKIKITGRDLSLLDICDIYKNYKEDLNNYLNIAITKFNDEVKKQLSPEIIVFDLITEIDLKEGNIIQQS